MLNQYDLEFFKRHFEGILLEETGSKDFTFKEETNGQTKPADEGDLVAEERQKNLAFKLEWRKALYLKKVKGALKRIDGGAYGECEECGESISMKRLLARPTAELCINCKEGQERHENHIPYKKRSHTTGKEIINDSIHLVVNKERNQINDASVKIMP